MATSLHEKVFYIIVVFEVPRRGHSTRRNGETTLGNYLSYVRIIKKNPLPIIVKEKKQESKQASYNPRSFPQARSRLRHYQLRTTSLYHGPGLLGRLRQHDDAGPPEVYYRNSVDMCQQGVIIVFSAYSKNKRPPAEQ